MEDFEITEAFKIKKGLDVFLLNFESNKNSLSCKNIPNLQLAALATYKSKKDREKRILARTFLFSLISKQYGVFDFDLVPNKFQKPFLKSGSDIQFSFSYSKDYVLVAISTIGKIGVDIEYSNSSFELEFLAKEVMCSDEWIYFNNLSSNPTNQNRYFFDLFSAKESIIKAFGTGLYFPVRELNTLKSDQFIFNQTSFQHTSLKSSLVNYAMSVCFEKN